MRRSHTWSGPGCCFQAEAGDTEVEDASDEEDEEQVTLRRGMS